MPVVGLGVWKMPAGRTTERAVAEALGLGYRLIDTAAMYGNEKDVGAAVRASGIPREEIFVTTKVWNEDHGYDRAMRAFARSERQLDVGPIDLYLIHWPVQGLRSDTWRALEKLQAEGRCRSIGVSNYSVAHLEELRQQSPGLPAADQVEFSPFLFQRELLTYCQERGIQLEAYAPLTRGQRLDDPRIARLATAHGKSPAQIVLRWALQHGVVVIPKTVHVERMRENAGLFDFALSAPEIETLDRLNEDLHTSWNPDRAP
ncbi:MAG: aldo/keto reductase [Thermoplasmata archaeon]|nr:aldo/keto reductase [Thermoplasmata archaeon]